MIQLELTNEEEQDLREEVEKHLTELEREIAHTDSAGFKNMLKRRRRSVRKLLEKLPDMPGLASKISPGPVVGRESTGKA